jgi:hypothetical protein
LSLSGDTLVVGAPQEDSSVSGVHQGIQAAAEADDEAPDSGAAYVFVRSETGAWSQQAFLKASNPVNTGDPNVPDGGDNFGHSVAIADDTIVVGAPYERSASTEIDGDQEDNSAAGAGAAYVFVRNGQGVWSQESYLKASNAEALDWFGCSVAISGRTVLVGAPGEDSAATGGDGDQGNDPATANSGAAYVFLPGCGGTKWIQRRYLKASNPGLHDSGVSSGNMAVAIDGETAVIGAALEDGPRQDQGANQGDGLQNSGAAYVLDVDLYAPGAEISVHDESGTSLTSGEGVQDFGSVLLGGLYTLRLVVCREGRVFLESGVISISGAHPGVLR